MQNSHRCKSSLTNESERRPFLVPKTQPTKNSSRQLLFCQDSHNFYQLQTCPEVSDFNPDSSLLYTHKLKIDYGHLEEPSHWPKKITIKNQIYAQHEAPQQTKRKQGSTEMQRSQEKTATKERFAQTHNKSTQLLGRSGIFTLSCSKNLVTEEMSASRKGQNPESAKPKKMQAGGSRKPRINEIWAAKNHSVELLKNQSQQSTQRNYVNKQNVMGERTQRPAQHCRIVRSYVGGSKMQIKIISYPDSSEYMKLCGHRN